MLERVVDETGSNRKYCLRRNIVSVLNHTLALFSPVFFFGDPPPSPSTSSISVLPKFSPSESVSGSFWSSVSGRRRARRPPRTAKVP